MDWNETAALSRALSLPCLAMDGVIACGIPVQWFVVERPTAFDVDRLIELDAETKADLDDGEEWARDMLDSMRDYLREGFTPDEASALREYLEQAHGCPLFTSPIALPLKPLPDGDMLATGRAMTDFPRKAGDDRGAVWLHRHYGYALPFKVCGLLLGGRFHRSDSGGRDLAIEVAPVGAIGVGL